jgi:hypothetical protein
MKKDSTPELDLIFLIYYSLIKIIEELPDSNIIKSLVKYNVISDFYDSWQFDDKENDVSYLEYTTDPNNPEYNEIKITSGIVNFEQANRYAFEFLKLLKNSRLDIIDEMIFPKEGYEVKHSRYKHNISYLGTSKLMYFKEYKLPFLNDEDFNNQMNSIFGTEYAKITELNNQYRKDKRPAFININKHCCPLKPEFISKISVTI